MSWASPAASGVGSTISLGGDSSSMATYGEAPWTSLVLWATAFVASSTPPAAADRNSRQRKSLNSDDDVSDMTVLPVENLAAAKAGARAATACYPAT